MKQFILIGAIIISINSNIKGQSIFNYDSTGTQLQKLANRIQEDTVLRNRLNADSIFTRALVQTLKSPYSFKYNFDSLTAIKHIISPDGRFKFFSWQVDLGDGTYRQRGAMQLPTNEGQLKLLPFFDNSDFVQNNTLGVYDRKKWIGAIYYDIIPIQFNGTSIYTLLGFDENNTSVSKKMIEVLRFENDEPILGGDFFKFTSDPTYPIGTVDRFIFSFKKGSNAIIRYEKLQNRIIISELASTDNDLKKQETLVPSGNFKYFVWINNKWEMSINEENSYKKK
jgi:acyl carrier protein